ncbi:Aerobic-type carbon monoxide dehydrogenase large subunit CoxL/CutL-like [Gaiella occulta]|uniref:Aerobic-type carbon monoxide dehydrogenase large subunit CoxL/CutL-like n=1 Tax=Gaiella occulta TaxID=1002870 RepID=A0A7M2Z1W7_9ACTN|nr:xanthine dehydrogenase family protein molybdopterin-binding subunit [Gaiella occulta]RDI76129.1 Aerobic-type carbon monoxide dehydrogenase large subunit CoxL/CutL-like [Gaiella occulta]
MTTVEEPRSERASFIRADGKEKVTGAGRYTADLSLKGELHAAFRYADHTHARILRIDATAARALPGVLAVITHEDVPDVLYGGMVQDRRLFARDTVRFEGDIVAAVAALTPEIARQAAALVEVDYEPLPVVTDFDAAMADGAILVHPDWEAYEGDEALGRNGNTLGYSTIVKGDADAAMAGADVVVRGRYVTDPVQGVPIEPRAVIAEWHGDRVTVWSSTQVPYAARAGVARTLQIPESHVRVIVPLLGGGFGAKCDFHFEGHVAALARAAGRPVKLVFSRHEEFFAVGHRREGMVIELETGARRDGTLVARRARLVLDKGAYCGEGGFFAQLAAMHACGPYEIENISVASYLNYSNNQPSSSIRAPTAPQVVWALEQHMDELAEALGLDPVELRRRTLIEDGSEGPTRQKLERIAMKETLERAVEMIGYGQELPEDEAIGVACGWWPCFAANAGAYVQLNHDGTGTIVTGAQENGTGAVMAMAAFVAEELGMRPGDFTIHYQDTDAAPWDMGSCGSQTTFNSARAVLAATAEVREQLLDAAAEQLEAARGDLELAAGVVRVKGSPDKAVAIADLASSGTFHGKGSGDLPEAPPVQAEGCVGRLGLESFLAPQLMTHAVRVKVDRETGVVRVLQVAAAHDSGRILNRMGADGQVYGGVVMGIGQALSEGTVLDGEGRHRNAHLLDYKLVTAADAPRIDIAWIETDTPNAGPRGSKGVGEPPCVPTAGAVANAVARVIGKHLDRLPMTPERVWEAGA